MHHESAWGPRPERERGNEVHILGKKIEPFCPFLDGLDGSYNADANAADEYAVILRHIDAENRRTKRSIPYPDQYPAYRELARRVHATFDIGSRAKDCILITHNITDPFAKSFNCQDDAFTKIKEEGTGFMISYLEVIPQRPSLDTLVMVEKRTLELQPQVRDQALEYVGANTVLATSY